jgi:nucleotide-binding universal stress UspA family protein
MIRVERILAGIDLGPDTEGVLAYASFFGKLWNASIDLLYVIDYLVTPPAYIISYIEEEKTKALKSIEKWQKSISNIGIETRSEVVVGRLYESFNFSIKKTQADLLVLGHRSYPFRRSSSERLIKGLNIPMLVIQGQKSKGATIGGVRIERILCPVDFSDYSRKALHLASEISILTGARLHIIHVLPGHLLKGIKDRGDEAIEDMRRDAEEKIREFIADLSLSRGEGIILIGEPYKEIVSNAAENDMDLIIMGARGLGLIEGILLGSVTDAVLRSSPCPVIIVH